MFLYELFAPFFTERIIFHSDYRPFLLSISNVFILHNTELFIVPHPLAPIPFKNKANIQVISNCWRLQYPLSIMDRIIRYSTRKHKISVTFIDIYITRSYRHLLKTLLNYSRTHILVCTWKDHKTNLNTFKRTEIIQTMFLTIM